MKGFPNQIANVQKMAAAFGLLADLLGAGRSIDDESYGEVLVRGGIIGARSKSETADQYLSRMKALPRANQSHQTTARGLKELFRSAGLIDGTAALTGPGRLLSVSCQNGFNNECRKAWREAIRGVAREGVDGSVSHPYQVMLRMLAERPGTPRSLCALALEAADDSDEELERVIALRDLDDEEAARSSIGATRSNWDNAKKILPSLAEQLGDVARSGEGLYLLAPPEPTMPSTGIDEPAQETAGTSEPPSYRRSRKVSSITIAANRVSDESGAPLTGPQSLVSLAEAIELRTVRTRRHNQLVRVWAEMLEGQGIELWEGEFDCLAIGSSTGVLTEVKTLNGSRDDEVRQVRGALAQLLYYERFSLPDPTQTGGEIQQLLKVALFDIKPTDDHIRWLESHQVAALWRDGDFFDGSSFSRDFLSRAISWDR